ncbi:SapC family protein [Sphingomonas glacialis]|uniref:Multidrug transporter n=1 Tax=Sphingomonas glacialis TaxID=658225 RepID=A0A502G4Y1_9SPHN|nr:SapC family protein [Sphingomonas glacialis]TPG56470.1 multidrug transporter [Sphingomonas glacialis]
MANHALLTSEDHRTLRIASTRGADFGDAVMSCLIVPSEFRRVQNDYPILFRLTPQRDRFQALAMFGFEPGENLFLDGDRWDARYRPLAMEIQPFLIGHPATEGGDKQIHLDLDSPRVASGGEGVRVFDDLGRPTPHLETIAGQLGELDAGWQASEGFFAALARHELLEPLTLEITLADGSTNRLVGYHAIAEERLQQLDAVALGELHADGHLLPMFMALASLSNVAELVDRKSRRDAPRG